MPVHNGANYLRVAMDSILLQRDSEIEVIALDDGSTDETPQILEAYRDRLNLVVRRRDPNGDWPSAVNCAMGLASGKYQCWLHHDDAWEHGRLAVLKDYIARWPEAVMVLHPSWFMSADGRRFGQWRCPLPSNRALEPAFVVRRLLVQNFAAAPAPLYKSQVVTVTGRLDERLWYTADWDFWLRVTGAGPTVYCPTPLACYRIHATSMTTRRTADSDALRRQYELVLSQYFSDQDGQSQQWTDVATIARFSALANIQLATWAAGDKRALRSLVRPFLRLGFRGWWSYLRDSRIRERAWNRIRVGALSSKQ
jgi:glycosyltransferase involved in cell wall biosynthesis